MGILPLPVKSSPSHIFPSFGTQTEEVQPGGEHPSSSSEFFFFIFFLKFVPKEAGARAPIDVDACMEGWAGGGGGKEGGGGA